MISFLASLIENRTLAVAVLASIGVIGASAVPWAHVATPLHPAQELGVESTGKITILCGVLCLSLIVAYSHLRSRDLALAAAAFGMVAFGLTIAYAVTLDDASIRTTARMLEIAQQGSHAGFAVTLGTGLWITMLAAVCVILASIRLALRGTAPGPTAAL
ncbi:MAG: hypothetical protein NVSMB57_17320 [Actinomycetota bacterium]